MYAEIKGTPMEERIKGQSQGELSGALMYFALADAAKAHDLQEAADLFTEIAGEHAAQAVFYASLVGRYPFEEQEFWQFIKGLSKAEEFGDVAISELAQQTEDAGFGSAAEVIRTFAAQHKHHAEVTHMLLEKYAAEVLQKKTEKQYVCTVCGYEYEGELKDEPEDFTCPLCGMPKESLR